MLVLKTSWLASSLLREEDQGSSQRHTCLNPRHICQSLTFSKAESDKELSYHGYTGEKTASALAGDSLHGISLCFHPKNPSTCAPPPPGHSRVEDPEHPTDSHYTVFLSVVREGFGLASSRKSCCSDFTGDGISPAPRDLAHTTPPPPPDSMTGLGQSLKLSSSHPSWAWYLNSGHHQKWLQ